MWKGGGSDKPRSGPPFYDVTLPLRRVLVPPCNPGFSHFDCNLLVLVPDPCTYRSTSWSRSASASQSPRRWRPLLPARSVDIPPTSVSARGAGKRRLEVREMPVKRVSEAVSSDIQSEAGVGRIHNAARVVRTSSASPGLGSSGQPLRYSDTHLEYLLALLSRRYLTSQTTKKSSRMSVRSHQLITLERLLM